MASAGWSVEQSATSAGGWRQEAEDLVRGMTGGLLIGIPLLYTQEIWKVGAMTQPLNVLLFLAIVYLLNLTCVAWAGFRRGKTGFVHVLTDALETTALAAVTAGLVLAILARIHLDKPRELIIGQIVVAAIPVSLGMAIANYVVARGESRAGTDAENSEEPAELDSNPGLRATLLDLGATAAGALFFCFNIAPTDEVVLLADELPVLYLPVIIAFSLAVTYGIVFVADFSGQSQRHASTGIVQHPVTETCVAFVVSLVVSAGALWLFGTIGPETDPILAYSQVIVLGLPAAIGGAAGRLAV
jgi:putative integral membrane protein (TIGR02587 family)